VRLLYQRGYTREQMLELFRILDWILHLPEPLERAFMHELIAFDEQAKMPYVTSIERLGREEGHKEAPKEGRQEGEALVLLRQTELKFGPPSEAVRAQINAAELVLRSDVSCLLGRPGASTGH